MDVMDTVEEPVQTCIIMCGNIGCGKTTVAEFLMQEFRGEKIVCICNDSITMMCGNGDYMRYNPTLGKMYKDMFMQCLATAIDNDASVICDNMHETEVKRRPIIEMAKEAGLRVVGIDLGPGSPETLKRRQDADDGRGTSNATWAMVHQRTAGRYEPMQYEEGYDCLVSADEIWEIINE